MINTSGCGTTVKDYGHMFAGEPAGGGRDGGRGAGPRRLGGDGRARPERRPTAPPLRVAYHAACSLQHGQQVRTQPKALLKAAGFEVVEPRDSHLCCGSAGTYNLLQPEIARELGARKVATLEERAAGRRSPPATSAA